MVRFGAILMSVCLTASIVLFFTYKKTNPLIILQREKEEKEALKSIFLEGEEFKKQNGYYSVYKNGNLIGYVLKVSSQGYAGKIEILVGFNQKGIIQGIKILEQKETPGLGAKISEVKYGEKEPWFLRQFKEKRVDTLSFKEINAITGATISSRAVMEAVKNEVNSFLKNINN